LNLQYQRQSLKVNPNKTKVLVFNKAGRHIQEIFMYENKILDCVVNYKYLGLHFSASGSFSFAQTELHKKTLKAWSLDVPKMVIRNLKQRYLNDITIGGNVQLIASQTRAHTMVLYQ
jgi:hypothetical protein